MHKKDFCLDSRRLLLNFLVFQSVRWICGHTHIIFRRLSPNNPLYFATSFGLGNLYPAEKPDETTCIKLYIL